MSVLLSEIILLHSKVTAYIYQIYAKCKVFDILAMIDILRKMRHLYTRLEQYTIFELPGIN